MQFLEICDVKKRKISRYFQFLICILFFKVFNVKEVNDGKEANLSQLNASRSGATMAQVKKSLKKSQLFENRKFLIIVIF